VGTAGSMADRPSGEREEAEVAGRRAQPKVDDAPFACIQALM